jgi:hypothetical protein
LTGLSQRLGRAEHRQSPLAEVLERRFTLESSSKQSAEMESLVRRAATDRLVARALSHPTRTAALLYLMHKRGEATDETELAESLGLSLPATKYHLTVLLNSNLITCVETGTTERYIAATAAGA